jgi:hypothetical protein
MSAGAIDRGIWAIWYELPEGTARSEYLDWFHHTHIPEKLARPGYLWAAHYTLGHGGARFQGVVDRLVHAQAPDLGRGRGFLALFGGVDAHTFMDPSPSQLRAAQDPVTRRMIGLRSETYTCIFAEETRVDGPEVKRRAPGITPGAYVQMGNFNVDDYRIEDDVGAWYAQHRLPFMAALPGCVGARKLLATSGWGKHSVLYEYTSLEAREARFVPHEEAVHQPGSWTARVLPRLIHAPCSPAVGWRIWPEAETS